jgi:hypothetical protein
MRFAAYVLMICGGLCLHTAATAGEHGTNALRGVSRVHVTVVGVDENFARYGLTAPELRRRVEQRLTTAGLGVTDDASAAGDAAVGELRVKLTAIESSYAFYSYALAVQCRRNVTFGPDSFVPHEVWSRARNGVINPSNLQDIYGYADGLVSAFLLDHGVDNGAARQVGR